MSDMNVVIVGHVDHGKSTIIGRLMADTHSLPQGKIENIREKCKRQSKVFEYAYLLDALKDEQSQGITIDTARCFFKTDKRNYLIMDAPGHVEFLKNMVTGASSADAALLVIDAAEGVQENSNRHGYLLSLLGVKQIIVLINKMDLVNYSQNVFDSIVKEYGDYLSNIEVAPITYIPVSGAMGDNIVKMSENMPWYLGMNILNIMDSLDEPTRPLNKPFRMPVQDIYKFTANNDSRRIIAGTVLTGSVEDGDTVCFFPSGKRSKIKSIESYNRDSNRVEAGYVCGLTLHDEMYMQRGELAFLENEQKPICAKSIRAKIFWLGQNSLISGKKYIIKIGHAKVNVLLSGIDRSIDASSLEEKQNICKLHKNHIGECKFFLERPIAFDLDILETSRFVLVDDYEICGGGLILSAYDDESKSELEQIQLRNQKWIYGDITIDNRIKRYGHSPKLILVTGDKDAQRKQLAKEIEKQLFESGYFTYYLGMGNLLHSVGANVQREDYIKCFSETAYIFLSAGLILVVSAANISFQEIGEIKQHLNGYELTSIYMGNYDHAESVYDMIFSEGSSSAQDAELALKKMNYNINFGR